MRHHIPVLDLDLRCECAHIVSPDNRYVSETVRQRQNKANDDQAGEYNTPDRQVSLSFVRSPQQHRLQRFLQSPTSIVSLYDQPWMRSSFISVLS